MYQVIDGRMVNEKGEVAIRYNMTIPKYIQIGKREYVFGVRANISLVWVHPDDVDKMLNMKKICCGGSINKVCHLANELDVKRWLNISIW